MAVHSAKNWHATSITEEFAIILEVKGLPVFSIHGFGWTLRK
jgi:hypothetical protein